MSHGQWPRTYPKPQLYNKKHGFNKFLQFHFILKTKKHSENILNKNSSLYSFTIILQELPIVFYNSPNSWKLISHKFPAVATVEPWRSVAVPLHAQHFDPLLLVDLLPCYREGWIFPWFPEVSWWGRTGSQPKNLRMLGVDFGTCTLFFTFTSWFAHVLFWTGQLEHKEKTHVSSSQN